VIYTEKEGELDRILTEIKGENEVIDFATIIPEPGNLFKDGLDQVARNECKRKGIPNWYDWNIENWGTKWNAYCDRIEEQDGEHVLLIFETAWTAPLPIVAALKAKYPDAEIRGSWLEEGHQSAGVF